MKKIFLFLMMLVPIMVHAAVEVDGISYDLSGTTASVTSKSPSYEGDIVIPSSFEYGGKTYSVTSIESWAFSGCSGLTSVTIPNSVTSIESWTFSNCSGLTSVTIPNSVMSIGKYAFNRCSGLTSVTIPNSVTSIGNDAFSGCKGLTSVTIPNSVTSIESKAFRDCFGLTSVTIPNSVTSIGSEAFYSCLGLTSVTIPNSVTSIGSEAFSECSRLTSVTIGNSVTSIGSEAFSGCYSLTSVICKATEVPSSNGNPFHITSFDTQLYVPRESLEKYKAAEYWKDFRTILPIAAIVCGDNLTWNLSDDGTLTISGEGAMYNYGSNDNQAPWISQKEQIKNLVIEEGVTNIGDHICYSCPNLTSASIPGTVTRVGIGVFAGSTKLESVEFPNCVTSIGEAAFYNCQGLKSVNIPASVTKLEPWTFRDCQSLRSLVLPHSITNIGIGALAGCPQLKDVYYYGDKSSWSNIEGHENAEDINRTIHYINIYGYKGEGRNEDGFSQITYDDGAKLILIGKQEKDYDGSSLLLIFNENQQFIKGSNGAQNLFVAPEGKYISHVDIYTNFINNPDKPGRKVYWKEVNGVIYSLTGEEATEVTQEITSERYSGQYNKVSFDLGGVDSFTFTNAGYQVCFALNIVYGEKGTSIKLNKNKLVMEDSTPIQLTATVSPATDNTVTWTSSNPDVATVDENGLVSPVFNGSTIITATLNDGSGLKACCVVTVKFPDTDITLYDNIIYANKLQTCANKNVVLPIYMKSEATICNLEFELTLPEGVDIYYGYDEDEEENKLFAYPGSRAKSVHTLALKKQVSGAYKILISSMSNADFKTDNTLPIANITLAIPEGMKEGEYDILIKNVILNQYDKTTHVTTPYEGANCKSTLVIKNTKSVSAEADTQQGSVTITGAEYDAETGMATIGSDVSFTAVPANGYCFIRWMENSEEVSNANPYTFTVEEDRVLTAEFSLLGDVFYDEKVNSTDLTRLVSIILNDIIPDHREAIVSDVYLDGKINSTDYTRLVGMIVDPVMAAKSMKGINNAGTVSMDIDAEGNTLNVSLHNVASKTSALQFDLYLPSSVKLSSEELLSCVRKANRISRTNHQIAARVLSDGAVRVLLCSTDNTEIADGDDAILHIDIVPEDLVADVELRNIVVSSSMGTGKELEDISKLMMFGEATSIGTVGNRDNSNGTAYKLSGVKTTSTDKGINIIRYNDGRNKKVYNK